MSRAVRDTIYALSSAPGRAGVAVVRISGPEADAALAHLTARALPAPRLAALRRLFDPRSGALIDEGLALRFPAPGSFTGEHVVELQVHGGPAVVAALLGCLGQQPNLRPASPGEFTRRAFEAGRLDLTAVEALADLIDAETEAQRMQALRGMKDGLGAQAERWRADLISAMALVEAGIDFSDEADVAADAFQHARDVAGPLLGAIRSVLDDGRRGEIVRDGVRVVIAGPPNAGKSSLLNALSRRDVAIVTPEAGTTRDVLEVRLDLKGIPVLFADTAGLREAPGVVEQEGVRRALARAREADLVIWLIDATQSVFEPPGAISAGSAPILRVVNKIDAVEDFEAAGAIAVSCETGAGLSALIDALAERAGTMVGGPPSLITRVRQRDLLERAVAGLSRFVEGSFEAAELRAEDLRSAGHALGQVSGRVDVEDVLDGIFGRFCIGK
jgi:tRNA modification GTPase